MVIDGSIRAIAVDRAALVPSSPVYQLTVLVLVPATSEVAVSNGGPLTRCGGFDASTLKKSLAASTAEAATNDVSASFATAAVREDCKLAAVAAGVAPMVNWFAAGGLAAVAVNVSFSVVPSGSVNVKVTASPGLGLDW